MVEKGLVRVGTRAIITNANKDKFLVEKNLNEPGQFLNFIGGGLELGETLDECLMREIMEETGLAISRMDYLFFVENFITMKGETIHGIGFYYLVELERDDIESPDEQYEFIWFSKAELAGIDLRPQVVRDSIVNGSFQSIDRLISKDILA
jgi:8-oxo-dGTP pyrophosphatase MutT (NUDIX family)